MDTKTDESIDLSDLAKELTQQLCDVGLTFKSIKALREGEAIILATLRKVDTSAHGR